MFEFDRLENEFRAIRNSSYTSPGTLANMFGVTERTIRSDINSINRTLENAGASIELKRRAGYHLIVSDQKQFEDFISSFVKKKISSPDLSSAPDRLRAAMETLLNSTGYIQQSDIADQLFISESTMQGYIRQIKEIFERYGLVCSTQRNRGIQVFGLESDRRDCYINEVIPHGNGFGTSLPPKHLFPHVDLSELQHLLMKVLSADGVTASDYGLNSLIAHFALMIERVSAGHIIETNDTLNISENARELITDVANELGQLSGISFPPSEQGWMYLRLLSFTNFGTSNVDFHSLDRLVDRLLKLIKTSYGFDFCSDGVLKSGIISHLKSIYKSRCSESSYRNPLLSTIKESFPLAFEISLTCTNEIFNTPPYLLDEGDVSYIALHVGAAIERVREKPAKKKRVILVCDSGRAALAFLSARIEALFSNRIDIAAATSQHGFLLFSDADLSDIDLIITTASLETASAPALIVDFRLRPDDIKTISSWLETVTTPMSQTLERFFSLSSFTVVKSQITKNDLLQLMCDQLVSADTAPSDLFTLVREREKLSNTALGKRIAIPHPMRPCASETRVSVAVLENPIPWTDQRKSEGDAQQADGSQVQLVFLLSLQQKAAEDIENLYDFLVSIVNNDAIQKAMIEAQSFDEFMAILDTPGLWQA